MCEGTQSTEPEEVRTFSAQLCDWMVSHFHGAFIFVTEVVHHIRVP